MAKRRYNCKVCSKTFAHKKRFVDHVDTHNKEDNNLIKIKPTNPGFKVRMKQNTGQTEFECSECYKTFKSRFKLVRHSYIHLEIKPFECDVCARRFARKDHLKVHFRLHTGEKRHFCNVCCRGFSTPMAVEKHMSTSHTGEKEDLSCPFCEIDFVTKAQLKRHFDSIHRNTYVCNTCGFSSFAIDAMTRHEKTHYPTYPLTCLMCQLEFNGISELMSHECSPTTFNKGSVVFKVVLNEAVDIEDDFDEVDSRVTAKFLRKFDGRGRKPKCESVKNKEAYFLDTDQLYRCKECDKSSPTEEDAIRHQLSYHSGKSQEVKLVCPFCDRTFPDSLQLKQHLRSHTGNRPFKCDICEKPYMRKEHLDLHKLTHEGLSLFNAASCSTCGAVFNSVESLEDHYFTEHLLEESDDEGFFCNFCSTLFSNSEDLDSHICIGDNTEGLNTSESEKKQSLMAQLSDLAVDKFPDDLEQNFAEEVSKIEAKKFMVEDMAKQEQHQCHECKRSFGTAQDLFVHFQANHTNDANLLCVLCEKEFSSSAELQNHLNSHEDNCVLEVGMTTV